MQRHNLCRTIAENNAYFSFYSIARFSVIYVTFAKQCNAITYSGFVMVVKCTLSISRIPIKKRSLVLEVATLLLRNCCREPAF